METLLPAGPENDTVLRRQGVYPLRDRPDRKTSQALGLKCYNELWPTFHIAARWNGKPKRIPKPGEWYLSGAVIEAYRASSAWSDDMTTEYHIAHLVLTEKIERVKLVKTIDPASLQEVCKDTRKCSDCGAELSHIEKISNTGYCEDCEVNEDKPKCADCGGLAQPNGSGYCAECAANNE